ncbi:uncharacterized protein OCT59_002007 [Rhizophagus irregularis]|uniref:Uncharacterized protein n=2 Tax=Rhizophagus irregularis TaxID=588596 RepID=A0A2H5TXX0_RHIID|nr:hypothetical protein GLOIN_2v1771167 [Rhizophagus irregularis DAOM 181602=DAOM 197198]POG74524.1 hypothetical protein GLOIN_2v1771167 [Rhizophagus irregularis DAOM 181602=DAOM 197198]UZO10423.1 hypothetical protein OCT59_002007 [Rhizophagus irregularis]GBC47421.1 hypothetical protein GLOIN_2v1771167 [Rhizophagus irregularis DAOM 181602=DAOM 197198]CAG8713553.1 17498_t:CDS:1 [Rhizophagus irregularis]|eukprot:XP_025181390.1 hypothetical protein GLOIN_2v1771167 [Rhizophagus irregularis DAOM 181602=DAOM 197198]
MQRLPVEVAERIITNLSDKDLFIGSSVCRVWWQIVRQEAYKRWKKYACRIGDIYKEIQAIREREQKEEIEWQEASYAVEKLNNCMGTFTGNQVYIINKMLKYEMIVDPQEREIIKYTSSEFNWGGDPWRFDWEWNEWTQQE